MSTLDSKEEGPYGTSSLPTGGTSKAAEHPESRQSKSSHQEAGRRSRSELEQLWREIKTTLPSSLGAEDGQSRDRNRTDRGATSRWPRFSALSRWIIAVNLVGLLVFMGGVLFLNQRSDNLISAHKRFLETLGRTLASALSETAVVNTGGAPRLDRELSIPILRTLIDPSDTHARHYDREGRLMADSNLIQDVIVRRNLAPPGQSTGLPNPFQGLFDWLSEFLARGQYYSSAPNAQGANWIPVAVTQGLRGVSMSAVRRDESGRLLVNYAVPIQPLQKVVGVLVLEVSDVEEALRAERQNLLRVFTFALLFSITSSILLARTIARPIRRLARAAEGVRGRQQGRQDIPDLTARKDEIGHLSGALRSMTSALYDRIDAIESFAADVAHEIKNPLTSLRSAVETFEIAKTDEIRAKLLNVIKDDVSRIDRLISDISNASRLDAELARQESEPVDIATLLSTLVEIYAMARKDGQASLKLTLAPELTTSDAPVILGLEGSLGQIFRNLVDNALSFSPADGVVRIQACVVKSRRKDFIVVTVEDQGPGIPPENLESIFERFYTERPAGASFGKHSGLGLSICRQIAEAHDGSIRVENIESSEQIGSRHGRGARFIVALPCVRR